MSDAKTNVLDLSNGKANMYGCQPCPKCSSKYRVPYKRNGNLVIECDCGFNEGATWEDDE